MIIYCAFVKYLRENGNTSKECISYFIDFRKACDSVRREVLYNNVFEFGIPMKLVMLIQMCLNETYVSVWVGKHLSDTFHIRIV